MELFYYEVTQKEGKGNELPVLVSDFVISGFRDDNEEVFPKEKIMITKVDIAFDKNILIRLEHKKYQHTYYRKTCRNSNITTYIG